MTASMMGADDATDKVPGLDDLLVEIFCLLDDELPRQRMGRPPAVSDAELVCLGIAQVLLDCPGERRWLRVAARRLGHLFPRLVSREQYNRRLRRLGPVLERALGMLAALHPSVTSHLLLLDTTPLPAGASVETTKRSELVGHAAYGWSSSHSRWYWGFKLVLLAAPDGFPIRFELVPANVSDQEAARTILADAPLAGRTVVGDRGFRGLEPDLTALGARLARPSFSTEPDRPRIRGLSRVRQWIESIIWTGKSQLSLERHGGRTLAGLGIRIALRLLALGAVLWFNALVGRPGRHLTAYDS